MAEADGKVLMKMGTASFEPEGSDWRLAEKGEAWAVWLRA